MINFVPRNTKERGLLKAYRSALYVIPKEPFKEWADFYNEESQNDLESRLNEKHIYLIDFFYGDDLRDILEPYYIKIFENELMYWNCYKHEWPKDLNLDVFLDWFEVILCDDIFDLKSGKIMTEKV